MTKRVENLISWFIENPQEIPGSGVFSTRNIAGDPMKTIYEKDGITVDACHYWDYIEVFGLSDDEFDEFCAEIISLYPEDEDDDED